MNDDLIDFKLIEKCIIDFIHKNKNHTYLVSAPITEESIKGAKVRKINDIWYLRDWAIQHTPSFIEAIWTYEWTPEQDTILTLEIKKTEKEYYVNKWYVDETF